MFTQLTVTPCASHDPELFFVLTDRNVRDAKAVCDSCPEAVACLMNAMDAENGEPRALRFGIYGGKTPDERFALAAQSI